MVYVVPTMKTYASLTSTTTIDKKKEIALLAATFLYLIRDPENPPANATTFNEYVALYNSFVIVIPSATPEGHVHYACNCPDFHESAACADVVAVGLFKGKFKAPLGKQLDLIGRIPQPGRPLKPASALQSQPLGKLTAKLKRQACKKRPLVEEDEATDREVISSQTVSNRLKCDLCNLGTYASKMLVCDGCEKGYHMHCFTPPLTKVPTGLFICMSCLYPGCAE
ncbi:hypothetical protein CYMTET_6565 [Cymbomonas tetramitiformis]|uniref:PHD-type domain-containing protein n=1 Tax=Cymbomonas tetramitiformis TaxID=36881 RepID=A0AAE0GWZ7_9CHLO|nr:hypothetical protein CYMTET_6565 [Cymbomonas tetramitiformis]